MRLCWNKVNAKILVLVGVIAFLCVTRLYMSCVDCFATFPETGFNLGLSDLSFLASRYHTYDKSKARCHGDPPNQICQYGRINPTSKYAMFSASLFSDNSMTYAFELPLSALAWRRIGYGCLVLLVGDPESCDHSSKMRHIFQSLLDMDHVVIITMVGVSLDKAVMMSQTGRLFSAALVQDVDDSWLDTYLITADADIWPIADDFLDLPAGKDILHSNTSLIEKWGKSIPYATLSYVGMKVRTWMDVMTRFGNLTMPRNPGEILTYLEQEFGGDAVNVTVKKAGVGWYMDQYLVTYRLGEWTVKDVDRRDRAYVYSISKEQRIDRAWWDARSIEGVIDAHVMDDMYNMKDWRRARDLLRLMYNNSTLHWCEQYLTHFNNVSLVC